LHGNALNTGVFVTSQLIPGNLHYFIIERITFYFYYNVISHISMHMLRYIAYTYEKA